MNGPLVDAAKKILKREYGVECTEPFAGVDRFRRTTGNTVAQVDLEGMKGGSVYKLRLCGFCYDNDEKYEEEKQIKPTESANPKGLAEIIDEYLSKVETNLHILIKTHRPYSKKKRILDIDKAKEILKSAGFLVEYIDHVSEPSTFGKSEYTVDYNWWPSDKSDYWVNRQDTVWLENPDDDDEIIEALSDILGEGSPEVEILSVN